MSNVAGTSKKGIWIGLVIGILLLGGGYLLWRVNQEDTVAPTDSDASEEECVLRCLPGASCVARDANDNCAEDEAGICYYPPYGGSKTGCCAYEKICNVTAYYITYIAGEGGSVTNAGQNNVVPGGSISSTATPKTGYKFVRWSDGKTTATRTDANVQADATYTATFEPVSAETVTLVYIAGTGGALIEGDAYILDNGAGPTSYDPDLGEGLEIITQVLEKGASGNPVTAIPKKGCNCEFVKWSDGKTTPKRTDTNVQANATYTALFQKVGGYSLEVYVLPVGSGKVLDHDGNDITGKKYQNLIPGSMIWAKAVPNPGYKFIRWQDGKTDNPRSENINSNTVWTATFEVLPADKVVLTYIAGPGGTITGTATQEINKGASGTAVTATPNAGYTFVKWSDGKTTATRTDTNVQVSATYTATFKSTNVVPKTGIFDDTGNTIALGVVFLMMGLEWTWVSTLPMKAYNAISFTTSKIKEDRESKRVQRRRNRLERRIK